MDTSESFDQPVKNARVPAVEWVLSIGAGGGGGGGGGWG